MPSRPLFRFVHASNLELDRFCSAGGGLTHEQGRALVDAPFRATERLFETALREHADLILLAGGAFVGPHPSTWGASFLARQCERIGRRGIQVAWIDAGRERQRCWPRFLPVPANLHVLQAAECQSLRLTAPSGAAVEVYSALDCPSLMRLIDDIPASPPPFRIAAVAQTPSGSVLPGRPIDYWAIAAPLTTETFPTAHGMARSAGTIQPRTADGASVGGCIVVDVGEGHSLGTRFVETNSIRFHTERFEVDDSTNWEGFRRRLHARTEEVLERSTADAVAFQWTVPGHGSVLERLMLPEVADELRREIAETFASRRPAAWLEAPQPVPDAVQEARWQREGSPFGALVRSLDALPGDDAPEVDLARLGPEPVRGIDPAATQVPRPHYQSLKSAARRHAAQVLSRRDG